MNYAAHHDRLIARARGRVLEGYRERHHVMPKCMGGDNAKENIVELTAEEHYVAHQLLVKVYPCVSGLALAAVRMAKQCVGRKAYAWLRFRLANEARARNTGRTLSAEHKAKIGRALVGRPVSTESTARRSAAHTGKRHSPEARAKMSAIRSGEKRGPLSPETRAKIAAAHRGLTHSTETKRKLADLSRGKGRQHTPEARAKIALAMRGNTNGRSKRHVVAEAQ